MPKRVGEMVGFALLRKISTLFLFIKTVKNRTYVVKVSQWAFELSFSWFHVSQICFSVLREKLHVSRLLITLLIESQN